MAPGKRFGDDTAWTVVRMRAYNIDPDDVRKYTSVSERQQRRYVSRWRSERTPVKPEGQRSGRPRTLALEDVAVSNKTYDT
jgi:hypothetical protein